jgi:hypothetical protein
MHNVFIVICSSKQWAWASQEVCDHIELHSFSYVIAKRFKSFSSACTEIYNNITAHKPPLLSSIYIIQYNI